MEDIKMDVKNIKKAKTKSSVIKNITDRWSTRTFSDKDISDEELSALFEAARWAPSSMNGQPWEYMYARKGTPEFDKFVDLLMPGNQKWAKNANVMVLSLARKYLDNGNENRHYFHDVGGANSLLLTQAVEHGIYGHMMGGYYHNRTLSELNIPEDKEPVCFIALGYLGDPETLDEPFRTRELTERIRKPISEFVRQV